MRRLVAALAVVAVAGSATASAQPAPRQRPDRAHPDRTHKELPALTPVARDALARALERGAIGEAEYALARAESLFALGRARARHGEVARPDPRSATFILRDLALRAARLDGADRARARALLARPTEGSSDPDGFGYSGPSDRLCSTSVAVCVHWAADPADPHAPDLTDDPADADATPEWIELNLATLEGVWAAGITAGGYRPPKSDLSSADNGGDARTDVYLADVGADFLYGFCTTDDPNLQRVGTSRYPFWDLSAYCVIDEDFRVEQFGTVPESALEVTVAHEFFHAVQFAYDFFEDLWFMEGTATFIEDEVYDDINDNHQYIPASALTYPDAPADYYHPNPANPLSSMRYGAWIFWRFLSESSGAPGAPNPDVVREVWELADGSSLGQDDYSMLAVRHAIGRGRLRNSFGEFGVWNYLPDRFYEEGADYLQIRDDTLAEENRKLEVKRLTLGASSPRTPRTGKWTVDLLHASSVYFRFTPGIGVAPTARLKLRLDLPSRRRGSEARAIVTRTDGTFDVVEIDLDRYGNGTKRVAFGAGVVSRVALVLTNASVRYRLDTCFSGRTTYSCGGAKARDDGATFAFNGTLVQ